MARTELARRVAAVERAKAPPPPELAWSPWQRLLTAEQWGLVLALATRAMFRPPIEGDGWRDGYRALCADDAERTMLEAIFAMEGQEGTAGQTLEMLFVDLRL